MSDDHQETVHEYRRQRLEPEIAAMSVEIDDDGDDNPTLIVNIDDPAAKGAIKKVIVWLGAITGIGWLVEWAQRSLRRQFALAVAGTATVATATTAVITDVARVEPRQSVVAQRVIVTLPPRPAVTVTASPTLKPTASPTTSRPERRASRPTANDEQPALQPSRPEPSPKRSRERRPTSPPQTPRPAATSAPAPTSESLPQAAAEVPEPSPLSTPASATDPEPEGTSARASPDPTREPEPESPAVAESECDGLVRVDLDPLLDLCLLG